MGSLSSSTQLKTTMKFLVLASCVALSAAQYGLVGHPNGAIVPVDEPAVAAARADHFAAGGGRGSLGYAGVGYAAAAPAIAAAPVYAAGYGYAGPLNLNTHLVGHPNGAVVPVDEPAVAAARADHLAARDAQYAAIAPVAVAAPAVAAPAIAAPIAAVPSAGYGYSGPLNLNTHLVSHPNGAVVPVDEPAVAAARADHFAAGGGHHAHAALAVAHAAPVVAHGHVGPLNLNTALVSHPNGAVVPADEPAV